MKSNVLVVLSACSFLISCTADRLTLDTPAHQTQITKDIAQTQSVKAPQNLDLSVLDAINMALESNLDARVSALETLSKEDDIDLARLQALPGMQLSMTLLGRSNEGASSSRSVATGEQSLVPSFSTERYRSTTELSVSWNILDLMLGIARSRVVKDEALIARERHNKVVQNIQRDVFSAYWRAKAYQDTQNKTQNLIDQTKKHIENVNYAERQNLLAATESARIKNGFYQQYETLVSLQNDLSLSEIELKSLLSLPQNTTLTLTSDPGKEKRQINAFLAQDLIDLEQEALLNRPEMRETILQKNIDKQNVRNEILSTIPGAEFFFASNKDTNQFLADSDWLSYSASITQNLISFFTLPARKRAAENLELLGDARRISLTAAILTQVHLARHRLQTALDEYNDAQQAGQISSELARAETKRHQEGLISLSDALPVTLKAQADNVRSLRAQAELQSALASMLNTLGRGFEDTEDKGSSL